MTALTERCPSVTMRTRRTWRGPTQLAERLAAGRAGELVVLGQLLQACGRGVHPTLTPHIARHIAHRAEPLTGTPVPAS
ncbi:hypothetical protein [Kitasatospora sp. GP82]|uniref:hypothetical protein n=1 Tax=Kitasatospora sp. GP82 TaxID=3035089 RepID=UPI0024754A29|nr:hypothetical protein [Kitasatospora sp. GP82]MDH6128820.1 hypothetical protein [Kitasatospora sp. GP82]